MTHAVQYDLIWPAAISRCHQEAWQLSDVASDPPRLVHGENFGDVSISSSLAPKAFQARTNRISSSALGSALRMRSRLTPADACCFHSRFIFEPLDVSIICVALCLCGQ